MCTEFAVGALIILHVGEEEKVAMASKMWRQKHVNTGREGGAAETSVGCSFNSGKFIQFWSRLS